MGLIYGNDPCMVKKGPIDDLWNHDVKDPCVIRN